MSSEFVLEDVNGVRVADGRVHLDLWLRTIDGAYAQADEPTSRLGVVLSSQSLLRLHEQLCATVALLEDEISLPARHDARECGAARYESDACGLFEWPQESFVFDHESATGTESAATEEQMPPRCHTAWVVPPAVRLAFRFGMQRESLELFVTDADDERSDFRRLIVIPRARCVGLIEVLIERLSGVRLTGPEYSVSDESLALMQRQSMARVESLVRRFPQAEVCAPELAGRCRVVHSGFDDFSIILSARSALLLVLPMSREEAHGFLGILFEMALAARWRVPALGWLRPHLRLVARRDDGASAPPETGES